MAKKSAAGQVLTPGGWRPKSKVHRVEPGQVVSLAGGRLQIVDAESGTVVKDLGAIQKSPRIKKPKPKSAKAKAVSLPMKRVAAPKGARPRKPITDGWIVYSGWLNTTGNPISYFKTRWAVPPAPATDHGQTIFLFNGIEPDDGAFILQPVLQWGSSDTAGDGSDWSITNWYVGLDGSALYSPLITVKTGDVLEGTMTLTGDNGSSRDYLSSFTGFPAADLVVNNASELMWANEVLECYAFQEFSDYPDTALTAFHGIEIRLRISRSPFTEVQATLNWDVHNDVTDNGQQCVIVSNHSPGGDVNLYYRASRRRRRK